MRNNTGFSLVELIVVIAIMAILAAVAIPTFSSFINKANVASDESYLNDLEYAVELALTADGKDYAGYELTVIVGENNAISYTYTKPASGTEGQEGYVAAATHTFTSEQKADIAAVVELTHDFKSVEGTGSWKIVANKWTFTKD